MSESFGDYLRRLRTARQMTLRDVERVTDGAISNAYLSQLEGDKIESPGVVMLHRLAAAYGSDFGAMCERACVATRWMPPPPFCPTCGAMIRELNVTGELT